MWILELTDSRINRCRDSFNIFLINNCLISIIDDLESDGDIYIHLKMEFHCFRDVSRPSHANLGFSLSSHFSYLQEFVYGSY